MNAKASDPHDLYLHLRARAFRLEIAIFTEQCCAGDDTVYGNGQEQAAERHRIRSASNRS